MKLKRILAVLMAVGCISAMGTITVSAESEENNSVIVEDDTTGDDDSAMDDIDLGNDDIFGSEDEGDDMGDIFGSENDSDIPVVDNVEPTPVTPVTPVTPTPVKPEGGTPSTGDAGILIALGSAITSVGGIAIGKRKL